MWEFLISVDLEPQGNSGLASNRINDKLMIDSKVRAIYRVYGVSMIKSCIEHKVLHSEALIGT